MARNKFSRINQPIVCGECGKTTTQTAGGGTGLCGPCYDRAGLENEHVDGCHDDAPVDGCPLCAPKAAAEVSHV